MSTHRPILRHRLIARLTWGVGLVLVLSAVLFAVLRSGL
jgi:hypothetical protein